MVQPCGESWEAMEGGSRVRHCGSCDRDVLNVAAMTPGQLEAVIAEGQRAGAYPCMRMVQLHDGMLLTATEVVRPRWYQRVAAGVGAMILATVAAAQDAKPVLAKLSGRVTDATGLKIGRARVELRGKDGTTFQVTADAEGNFVVTAAPGAYEISAASPGFTPGHQTLVLREGDQAMPTRLKLQPVLVFMGAPPVNPSKTPMPPAEVKMPASVPVIPFTEKPTPTQR